MCIMLHPLSLMHHPSCLKLAIALQYGMGVKGGRMRDGRWDVVPPLSLLSWTSRHAQSSSDWTVYLSGTLRIVRVPFIQIEEKAK